MTTPDKFRNLKVYFESLKTVMTLETSWRTVHVFYLKKQDLALASARVWEVLPYVCSASGDLLQASSRELLLRRKRFHMSSSLITTFCWDENIYTNIYIHIFIIIRI